MKDEKLYPAERSEVGGSSNTPSGSYENSSYGTCVDYFKYRFDFGPKEVPEALHDLFEIMHVTLEGAARKPGRNNYEETVLLGDEIALYQGGNSTRTKEGYETCLLELKGKGCREFEERCWSREKANGSTSSRTEILNNAWIRLIKECLRIGGTCTRIDLTTDDFSGNISVDEVKEKMQKREFTAKTRRIEITSSEENTMSGNDAINEKEKSPYLDDMTNINDSKRSGYTATLGTRDRLQLCIYDKAAEQTNKGNDKVPKNWIRYEVRFMKENADKEIPRFLKALEENKESAHIVGCLASIFEFKEASSYKGRNLYKAETWSKWQDFVKGAELPEAFANTPWTMTIESNALYLMTSCSGSFVRLLGALDANIGQIGTMMVLHEMDKMKEDGLEVINQYRRKKGLPEFKNLDHYKRFLSSIDDLAFEFNPLVTELLAPEIDKKTKKKKRRTPDGT